MRTINDAVLSLQKFFGGLLPEPWDVRTDLETGVPPVRPFALIEAPTADSTAGGPTQRIVTFAATVNLFLPQAASRQAATDAALELRAQVADAIDWGDPDHRVTTGYIPLWAYDPRYELQRINVRGATGGTWRILGDLPGSGPPLGLPPGLVSGPIAYDAVGSDVQAALNTMLPGSFQVEDRASGVFDVWFIGALTGIPQSLLGLDVSGLDWGAYPFVHPVPWVKEMQVAQPAPWRAPSDFMTVQSFGQNTVRDATDETLAMVAVDLRLTFARARPLSSNRRLLERISATEDTES